MAVIKATMSRLPLGMVELGGHAAPRVILASASRSRAAVLAAAGVPHRVEPAQIDEASVKRALQGEGALPFMVADTLAELKAKQVAQRYPDALVIGADQILECDGRLFDKPRGLAEARAHLLALRGRLHRLLGTVCVVRRAERLWHYNSIAEMDMRGFSDGFLDRYLAAAGERVCDTVGAYELEGLGAQLFAQIRGDFFAILGLPLLQLLDFLRQHDVVPQ